MMTRWPSPAKLNLFLYITGQRLMVTIPCKRCFSLLTMAIRSPSNRVVTAELRPDTGRRVADEDNLIVRAARLLMRAASEVAAPCRGKRCGHQYREAPADGRRSGRRLI